eukprot:4903205-Amphidinium_carterae.1
MKPSLKGWFGQHLGRQKPDPWPNLRTLMQLRGRKNLEVSNRLGFGLKTNSQWNHSSDDWEI